VPEGYLSQKTYVDHPERVTHHGSHPARLHETGSLLAFTYPDKAVPGPSTKTAFKDRVVMKNRGECFSSG
jgi:hypothetical protein